MVIACIRRYFDEGNFLFEKLNKDSLITAIAFL